MRNPCKFISLAPEWGWINGGGRKGCDFVTFLFLPRMGFPRPSHEGGPPCGSASVMPGMQEKTRTIKSKRGKFHKVSCGHGHFALVPSVVVAVAAPARTLLAALRYIA